MEKLDIIRRAIKQTRNSGNKCTALKVEFEANLDRDDYDEDCLRSFLSKASDLLGRDVNLDAIECDDYAETENPMAGMRYIRCYNDGSVDTEITFTIMLDDEELVLALPKLVEAWNSMCKDYGCSIDTDGAGMHMALLNNEYGDYPSRIMAEQEMMFDNFRRSMTLLLPALYFLASPSGVSRSLYYRRPYVRCNSDSHGSSKFNAINYKGGAIEFRIFDTCYDNPEAILDNFVVMANTMRYWRRTFLNPGLDKITNHLPFGNDTNRTLERFYTSETHLQFLSKGLERIKPAYYTISELKKQRGFKTKSSELKKREKLVEKEAQGTYQEYQERFKWMLTYKRYERLARLVNSTNPTSDQTAQIAEYERTVDVGISELKRQQNSLQEHIEQYVAKRQPSYEYNLSI